MNFDVNNVKCPKCGCKLTSKDFVGARYDDGLTRRQGRRKATVPNPSSWRDYEWVYDVYTKSNVMFFRCTCGANVRVKMYMKVEPNGQGESDE